ncbi:four-carbon acid sugar kinase family protein [Diaminobutyricibacter tongyongensis]|uniref:3-oxo-tetronate kinase n=1 Tax=Leifsonia tongyongensis TaxID=1268043 RepID=A0A6L9Y1V7_9MICO|nr:3-oxo-tetronate kinase [Diaminobutyricibacter tongyongensis]NEN07679.1 four-carbon acid sugar kinase family protein [Diaminobutyricibacter tongyongensis]
MIAVIADDVTGGTDAASACRGAGLRTLLSFGIPLSPADEVVNVHVVALKTRSIPAQDAVRQTLDAARVLLEAGADSFYFKYCSTFDSTADGNIGPVLDALSDLLNVGSVVTTPAAPSHGRTVYRGYLFVGDKLLAESHMRNHPLTPMRDSSVLRLLGAQTARRITMLDLPVVRDDSDLLQQKITDGSTCPRYLVADAICDDDLRRLAHAIRNERFAAGSAGLISAIARERARSEAAPPALPLPTRSAVVAGSCSEATLGQIAAFKQAGFPWYELDVLATPNPEALEADALAWFDRTPTDQPALIYSSRSPEELAKIQAVLGVERSAQIIEHATAEIAAALVRRGVGRIVAAGGETSGAVVKGLKLRTGLVGREAALGVPWIHFGDAFAILLKSGNFGDRDLLVRAATQTTT